MHETSKDLACHLSLISCNLEQTTNTYPFYHIFSKYLNSYCSKSEFPFRYRNILLTIKLPIQQKSNSKISQYLFQHSVSTQLMRVIKMIIKLIKQQRNQMHYISDINTINPVIRSFNS